MNDVVDHDKRQFLRRVAALAGVVGVAGFATPFVASLFPSKKSLEASGPVRVDLSQISPGKLHQVLWQGKPVTILHRTPEQLQALSSEADLSDPDSKYSKQPDNVDPKIRSLPGSKEQYLVVLSVCTHLGCVPNYDVAENGFACPCHQSVFDLAGRVKKDQPANSNLEIPPYRCEGNTLIIGES